MFLRISLAISTCLCALAYSLECVDAVETKKQPTLEEAYRKWHSGLAAKEKADREKSLRSMLANQEDVKYLFPKHADKLWPLWAKGNEFLVENVDQIAKEVSRGGEIVKVEAIDMRKEKKPPQGYKRLFEIIPKNVPVFEISVQRADGGGGSSASYVYLKNRWLWIKDLDTFPRILEELK
jgi:hypothetical protein